jgi:hypothetical protein
MTANNDAPAVRPYQVKSSTAVNCFRPRRSGAEMGIDLAGGFADSSRIAEQSLHLTNI